MKRFQKLFLCLCFMVYGAAASAQTMKTNGNVSDDQGESIIGATIIEVGTNNGTTTDVEGNFSFAVKSGAMLEVRYIGCEPVKVKAGQNLKIVLKQISSTLEDVVVIGYGTARKKDLTGSVTQVKADKFQNENPASVQDLLRSVSGLSVGITNDAKGGGSLLIRGQNSLGTGSNPLLILDGMIFYGELSEVNPDDIAQIDVLKDASAAAVYGAQAANGVIIITTKKGKVGKPLITLTANLAAVDHLSSNRLFTTDEYIQHKQDYYESSTYGFDTNGEYVPYQSGYENTPGYFRNPSNLPSGVSLDQWRGYTQQDAGMSDYEIWLRRINFKGVLLENALNGNVADWEDYAFRTGFKQDYNVSVSGASEKVNYYLSAGYLYNKGVRVGDCFRQFRATMKLNMDVTKWLTVGASVKFQDRSDDSRVVDWGIRNNSPYSNVYDEDGGYAQFPNGPASDYTNRGNGGLFYHRYDTKERGATVFQSQFNAKVNLPYGFTYTFNIAPRYQFYYNREWLQADVPDRRPNDSGANRDSSKNFDWSLNNILNWNKKYGDHDITVTLVQEAEERKFWSDGINARDITPTDALGFHLVNNANMNYSTMWSNDTHTTADGLLARGQYNYDNRYLFTASVRRDGYCAFGANYPHATFPSMAASWVFSNEKFWPLKEIMDYGKLRISWGKNGNRDIGADIALANLITGGDNRTQYIVNGEIVDETYLRVDRLANPNLKWENTTSTNFGLDFGFLGSRITGSLDVYFAQTKNMIMNQRLPGFSGYTGITTNLGQVDNKGVELSIHSNNIQSSNFEWTTDFTFSYNKNTIRHLLGDRDENGKETDIASNGWFIGHSIGEIWDFKSEGVWSVAEADEAAKFGQVPGDIKVWNNPENDVYDENGNFVRAVYNDEDKVFLGQTNAPVHMTMRNDFTLFKNFSIGLSMYSYCGYKAWKEGIGDGYDITTNHDNIGGFLEYRMMNQEYKRYWTPEHQYSDVGRINANGPVGAEIVRSYKNRSFLRFDNLSFAYSLPKSLLRYIDVESAKVYFNINNLGTIHSGGWNSAYGDPENGTFSARTYTFGINLQF